MNRIGKSVSSLIIAGLSILLVGGALITTLAQTGFAPAPDTPPTNTAIQVATQPVEETASLTAESPTSTPDSGAAAEETATSADNDQTPTPLTATATSEVTCTIPTTWIKYTVKSGDTLFSIAQLFQTKYQTLQAGNCMGSSTRIITGDTLFVPNNATITPTPKPTKAPTKVPTNTSVPPTDTPTCYSLNLSHSGNGADPTASPTKSIGCANGSYIEGEVISLEALPTLGYQVDSWSGTDDDGSTSTSNSWTMTAANHAVNVTYSAICYALTLTHTGTGNDPTPDSDSKYPSCSPGEYIVGEDITLTASGGTVIDWYGTNASDSNIVTMPAAPHEAGVNYTAP